MTDRILLGQHALPSFPTGVFTPESLRKASKKTCTFHVGAQYCLVPKVLQLTTGEVLTASIVRAAAVFHRARSSPAPSLSTKAATAIYQMGRIPPAARPWASGMKMNLGKVRQPSHQRGTWRFSQFRRSASCCCSSPGGPWALTCEKEWIHHPASAERDTPWYRRGPFAKPAFPKHSALRMVFRGC